MTDLATVTVRNPHGNGNDGLKSEAIPADLNPVHTWRDPSGHWIGQGTRLEFDHWRAEGVIGDDVQFAELLCHEPASEDERRKAAWAWEVA